MKTWLLALLALPAFALHAEDAAKEGDDFVLRSHPEPVKTELKNDSENRSAGQPADRPAPAAKTSGGSLAAKLEDLQVGARIGIYQIRDDRRSGRKGIRNDNYLRGVNYIGSLWGLDEEQDYLPRIYAQYTLCPHGYGGIGLAYDSLKASTIDWGDRAHLTKGTDGDVSIQGPMAYVFGRYLNSSPFCPFGELGVAFYSADFDESPRWRAQGPEYRFEVDDTEAWFLSLGCRAALNSHWDAEVYYRRLSGADVDARAYFYSGSKPGRVGSFPLDYDLFAVGASYSF